MIVTVTLNPAMDKTARLARLAPGGLNRLEDVVLDAGGKGVNVSKTIAALGGATYATGFLGGGSGREIERLVGAVDGVTADFVMVALPTRTNLKVLTKAEGITEFNEPGPVVTPAELDELTAKLVGWAAPGVIVVMAGSLPGGLGADTYARLIGAVKAKGAAVFLDADGQAFRDGVAASPDYIKPNRFELTQYFDQPEDLPLVECASLCRRLVDGGVRLVTLSLGGDGALFVTADEILHAPGLTIQALSTVGAGDAMVAALVHALSQSMSLADAARLAMATSAGACLTEGTKPPDRASVDSLLTRVTFTPLQ